MAVDAVQYPSRMFIFLAVNAVTHFIARAEAGTLPIELAKRIYRILLAQENRLDRGELADLRRRAALEEAFDKFQVRARVGSVPPLLGAHIHAAEHSSAPAATSCDPVALEPEPAPMEADEPDDTDRIEIQNAALLRDLIQAMAPSAQERLASERAYVGSAIARQAVLLRWIEKDRQAHAIAAAIAGRYRGLAPAAREPVNRSIAPWLTRRL
jgi:hypothetical protein